MARSSKSGWPYVSLAPDNRGKLRARFRRRGYSTYLPLPTDPEFHAAYGAAMTASDKGRVKTPKASLYSLEWTAIQLRQTPEWRALGDRSLKAKTRLMDRMIKPWGPLDMTALDSGGVVTRLDEVKSPTVRNRIRGIFGEMFSLLLERQIIARNPIHDVKRIRIKTKHTAPWTDVECEAFEGFHKPGTKARLAYELFRSTVQASVDIAGMSRTMMRGGMIRGHRVKTGEPYEALVMPGLDRELAHHKKTIMFLLTDYGKPFSEDGFNDWFNENCKAAGIAARSHGLRVRGCVELAEAGCTAKELMAISGHKTLSEAQRYVQMASARILAKRGGEKRLLSSAGMLDKIDNGDV